MEEQDDDGCSHLGAIRTASPRTPEGCGECLAQGSRWVHLRLCLTCGNVGCCDSSPNQHASKHAATCAHPLVQSFQPGEDWAWCYADELYLSPELVSEALRESGASTV